MSIPKINFTVKRRNTVEIPIPNSIHTKIDFAQVRTGDLVGSIQTDPLFTVKLLKYDTHFSNFKDIHFFEGEILEV